MTVTFEIPPDMPVWAWVMTVALVWYLGAAVVVRWAIPGDQPDDRTARAIFWTFSPNIAPIFLAVLVGSCLAYVLSLGCVQPCWRWDTRD